MMRLNKFLAGCGFGSRRKCEQLIQAGRVAIDGRILTSLSQVVDEQKNIVTVDGQRAALPDRFIYILLNKPGGYVTTARDELGRKTVLNLVPASFRVFPVGRLDKDTTGALLLTNDGQLAFRLMHPRFRVDKIYHVTLDQPIADPHIEKLQSGIMLEDGITSDCQISVDQRDRRKIKITLHEGRKRQIRRMLQALGYDVVSLSRIQFAMLELTGLETGKWRYLTDSEVVQLKKNVSKIQ